MSNNKRNLFSKGDIFIVGTVIIISLCFLFSAFNSSNESDKAVCIKVNGEIYTEISLSKSQEPREIRLENNGHNAVIYIEKGEVCFSYSDCPDKLCVNQGKISKTGESIVCLPGRFSASIISLKNDSGLDAVVH